MIENGGLVPDVLGMSRGFTFRHAQTIESFDMQFNAETLRPLAQLHYPQSDSPQSPNRMRVTFIPRERPCVKHYCL